MNTPLMPGDALPPQTQRAPGGSTSAGNQAAWLKQFESAQWQQRGSNSSTGLVPQKTLTSSEAQQSAAPSGRISTGPLARESSSGRSTGASVLQSTSTDSRAATIASTSTRGSAASTPLPLISPSGSPMLPSALAPELHRAAMLTRRGPTPRWTSQHAHALLDAEGVKLWLRDARVAEGDGQRMLQALRGQFARLGLRLAGFTLNGITLLDTNHPNNKQD